MSLKELSENYKLNKLKFGLRSVLKSNKSKKNKSGKIFVAKNARVSTIETLQKNNINFEFSKTKEEISKELNLDFESEIFLIE
jgi:ribosomal protein L7Ae-like RNA K-turn-binding protein